LHLGNVGMEIAERIALELLLGRLVTHKTPSCTKR
jgi:hypothetical protein